MSDKQGHRRLPAEWERQATTILPWPHPRSDWHDALAEVEPTFAQIGAAISRHQRLFLLCPDDEGAKKALRLTVAAGGNAAQIICVTVPTDDTWARDFGPLTVIDGDGPILCDFVFNGWGGKYRADDDNAVTATLCRLGLFGEVRLEPQRLVLEGGAIESDGEGTVLATRRSFLSATRNPNLSLNDIERSLRDALGLRRVLWLGSGALTGDDTDGHIDMLARFADPRTILYGTTDSDDPDYTELSRMRAELSGFRTMQGQPYRLIGLPPSGRHFENGRRLPASYANFLIINGAVLLPVYGVPNDGPAISIVGTCFPDRDIIPIDCRSIIRQNGGLHCLTMQLPAAVTLASLPKSSAKVSA